MLIIGNKPYINLKLDNILDVFDENTRLNLGLPNYNNGTKIYNQYFNCHIYENLKKKKLNIYKNSSANNTTSVNDEYIDIFIKKFDIKNYKNVFRQCNDKKKIYNSFLNNIKCPYKFNNIPRVGCNAIFDLLIKNKKVYISNFSLIDADNGKHMYNSKNIVGNCHNIQDEMKILIWLHNNNFIDATLSNLKDTTLPFLDCSIIKSNYNVISLLINQYGICILENYFNDDSINILNNEFDNIFLNYKKKVEILDKEGASKDERIFFAEKYSNLMKKYISDDILFNSCAKNYKLLKNKSNINKKLLLNKLDYEDNVIKNSGAGWHRDNHNCQFKVMVYLTDVTEDNGNFQFLTNSSKKHIGFPTPRTENYNTRFKDDTIKDILEKKNNVNLHNIIGKKGTVIIVDTTYIHRGNIIKKGIRKAITQYFF